MATPPDISGLYDLTYVFTGFLQVGFWIAAVAFILVVLLKMLGFDPLNIGRLFGGK